MPDCYKLNLNAIPKDPKDLSVKMIGTNVDMTLKDLLYDACFCEPPPGTGILLGKVAKKKAFKLAGDLQAANGEIKMEKGDVKLLMTLAGYGQGTLFFGLLNKELEAQDIILTSVDE